MSAAGSTIGGMRISPPPFHPNRPSLVAPVRIDRSGVTGPKPHQARHRHWRRTSQGLYVPSAVDGTVPEQRIVEAASVLPEYGGVTGWAALRWFGGSWFDGMDRGELRPVCLVTAENDIRPQAGLRVSAERLRPDELTEFDGLRLTHAARSVAFEMRYARSLVAAVQVLDMAAYSDLVSIDEVAEFAAGLNGWTGVPRCREALEFADENSWSPAEVNMRVIWRRDAGLPRPVCNRPLFDLQGNFIGTPDLFDPETGVVGEYDGAPHLAGAQRRKDVEREARYRDHGCECFTMVAGDIAQPNRVVERMLNARERAARRGGSARNWTLELPPGWVSTHTVALRRALSEEQRRRFLGYRAS